MEKSEKKRALRNVLVVEDHPELRNVLKECLEGLGMRPVEAADARSALACLEASAPDLVCLDVVLPESSGYELCEYIRSSPALRSVPVLMMSGRRLPVERALAAEAGADYFLEKPFTQAEFQARVENLLATGRPSEEEEP